MSFGLNCPGLKRKGFEGGLFPFRITPFDGNWTAEIFLKERKKRSKKRKKATNQPVGAEMQGCPGSKRRNGLT